MMLQERQGLLTMDYTVYMRRALRLAEQAAAAGEVPVGAVVVRGGEVIAEAANSTEAANCPPAHAEMLALRQAQQKLGQRYLEDCTLFVTMEPCPMCAGAIVLWRVGQVVFGCPDSRWGACGSLYYVPAADKVIGGICEDECREVLQQFFRQRRQEGYKIANICADDEKNG